MNAPYCISRVGNYLNGGSNFGQSWGVSLGSLEQLNTVRAVAGDMSLMRWLAAFVVHRVEGGPALIGLRHCVGAAMSPPTVQPQARA